MKSRGVGFNSRKRCLARGNVPEAPAVVGLQPHGGITGVRPALSPGVARITWIKSTSSRLDLNLNLPQDSYNHLLLQHLLPRLHVGDFIIVVRASSRSSVI